MDRCDHIKDGLTCKPITIFKEIAMFINNPPPWRSLCIELQPHSVNAVRNKDVVDHYHGEDEYTTDFSIAESFCHWNPYQTEAKEIKRHERKKLPRTLVCHDMANGYHDDSKIDGTNQYDAYTFYNWAGIDIFCYFSHHFITIPPLGWINVGHMHGVQVLGTVITEWADGTTVWDTVLSSESSWKEFAASLVAIAKILKFDGWLLNVENKISKPEELAQFVKYLHTLLHQEVPNSLLIWYDSVTSNGQLSWQNGLNASNRVFFDACDGIFTNYSWTEDNIKTSVEAAGDRLTDLFIGIDVWGRNFYGGGQFNTQEAVKVAFDYGCSLAIFAPAWTHEAMNDDARHISDIAFAGGMTDYKRFMLRDRAFWGSIWPYLNTKLPSKLPFQTPFCRGLGIKRRMYGEVLAPSPWYNLRHMQYQPNSAHGPHGYLLSTVQKIYEVTKQGILKDNDGTIRYRETFQSDSTDNDFSITNSEYVTNVSPAMEPVVDPSTTDAPSTDDGNDNLTNSSPAALIKSQVSNKKNEIETEVTATKRMKTLITDMFRGKKSANHIGSSSITADAPKENTGVTKKIDKTRFALVFIPEEKQCLETYLKDSFIGGSCLKINPSDERNDDHRLVRLFHCDFLIESVLVICVVTKCLPGFENQSLNMKLSVKDASGNEFKVILIGRDLPGNRLIEKPNFDISVYPFNARSDPEFKNLQRYLLIEEPGFYISVENPYGWKVRYYQVHLPGANIMSVSCRTGLVQGPILLGHFGLCNKPLTKSLS